MKRILKTAAVSTALAMSALLAACGGASASDADLSDEIEALELVEPGVLKVGVQSDSKPYSYIENGELTGFEVDMATAIAEEIGLEVEFTQREFSTLIPAVASGQLDAVAASTSITPERQEIVDFSDTYYIGYISIITKKDSPITEDVSSLDGVKLGIVQGTMQDVYTQENFKNTEIVRFPDNNAIMQGISSGSVDAGFIDLPPAGEYMAKDETLHTPINIELPDFPVGMPLGKEKPKLKEAVNTAIADLIESGEWLEINDKYYPESPVNPMFLPADGATAEPTE